MSIKNNMIGEVVIFVVLIMSAVILAAVVQQYTTVGRYGNVFTQSLTIDPSAANTTTLTHTNVYNNSAYITALLNSTGIVYNASATYPNQGYHVSAINQITWHGLRNNQTYVGTIRYQYLLSSKFTSLLNLAPLMYVIIIIGVIVYAVIKHLRGIA